MDQIDFVAEGLLAGLDEPAREEGAGERRSAFQQQADDVVLVLEQLQQGLQVEVVLVHPDRGVPRVARLVQQRPGDDQRRPVAHAGALAHALALVDRGFRMVAHATLSRSRSDWIIELRSRKSRWSPGSAAMRRSSSW